VNDFWRPYEKTIQIIQTRWRLVLQTPPRDDFFHSTGQAAKARADEYVLKLITGAKPKRITLSEYARDFFDWDKCQWLKRQFKQGKHFTRLHVLNRRRWLQKYLTHPEFWKAIS
jgi:hypothetical protein